MKQQLTKFKTEYDLHANYNSKGLHEAKKDVYNSEISTNTRLSEYASNQFTLKPLEIGFIQSLALKDDPKFIEIQKLFAKYNTDVQEMKTNPSDGLHLKKVVMDSMLKFLRMMMLAPNSQTKKVILDISYFWFIKHLNPKSQRQSKGQMLKEIKEIVSKHQLLPKSVIERQLPSEKLANDLQEYRARARTYHKDIDAPEHELHNYNFRKVGFITYKDQLPESQEEQRRKKLLRVAYLKPNLQQYYLPPEEEVKEAEKVQIIPVVPTPQPVPDEKPLGPDGLPIQQPPMSAEMAAQMEMLNQMGGQPEEPEEVVPLEEDEDKKRGKLDPFVKVFLRKQLQKKQKEGSFQHPPINQLERYKNNYKQVIQREDEMFSQYMSDWAAKRSRFKSQTTRKNQSIRMNHYKQPKQTIQDASFQTFQNVFYQTRINEAIRDGRKNIRGELNRQKLNTEGSLSCFDRHRAKTATLGNNKPFSQIIQQNKRFNKRQESLNEIDQIKQKFAKHKIFTSMHTMKGGLMHPQQRPFEQQLQKVEYPTCLPSNPFFVVKKKKKKGKKKK